MKIKIYTVYHKKFHAPYSDEVQPIQVGNLPFFGPPYVRDNTGQNISNKNGTHCELTALYWMRYNDLDSEYLGLMHYRRWFDLLNFGKPVSTDYHAITEFDSFTKNFLGDLGLNKENVSRYLNGVDIVVPEAWNVREDNVKNIYEQYKSVDTCRIQHLDRALEITNKLYPEYKESVEQLKASHILLSTNMFIMKAEIFREYMDWLMSILDLLCKEINFEEFDVQVKRAPGFIAERLFTLWTMKNKSRFKIRHAPRVFIKNPERIQEKRPAIDIVRRIKKKSRRLRKLLIFKLLHSWSN